MATHFINIGFPAEDDIALKDLSIKAATEGERFLVKGGEYVQWKDEYGAEIWVQMDKKRHILSVDPHFSGKGRIRVGVVKTVTDPKNTLLDGFYYGWANPVDEKAEEGDYPFVFFSPGFLLKPLRLPRITNVQLSAFSYKVSVYPDEELYNAAQKGIKHPFAAESFIPSGLFVQKGEPTHSPRPYAILAGRVVEYSLIKNSLTGANFHWALLHTYGGEIDVVIAPDAAKNPILEGSIISGSFWLSGKFV
jgi:hypothetical protein